MLTTVQAQAAAQAFEDDQILPILITARREL